MKKTLALLALLVLGFSTPGAQSIYPNAITDRLVRQTPDSITVPASLNATFVDPSFGRVLRRLTNGTVGNASNQNASHRTPSSEQVAAWGHNSDRFYDTTPHGTIEYFAFDASNGHATYVRDLPFTSEPTFSRVRPSIIYGAVGYKVIAYDTDTLTSTTLLDLTKFDPAYAVAPLVLGGTVQSSAGSTERLVAFYGGSSQDKHFRAVVFDVANPAGASVLDTVAKTLNGVSVSLDASFHLHAIGMDQSGRYAILYPAGTDQAAGAAPMYAWDIDAGIVTANRTSPYGHDASGFGLYVNNDNGPCSPYDALQYQFRKLSDIPHPTCVVVPPLTPKMAAMEDHPQWNNARPDVILPFVTATIRYYEDTARNLETDPAHRVNTVPYRAGDNEILSIDPVTGTLYRWAHHFADIYADDGEQMGASFWYQPIPQISPDGRWILFDSNMLKTLGLDAAEPNPAAKHRADLFLIDTAQPLTTTAPSGQTSQPTVIVSPTALVSLQPFTVTVTGDCTDVSSVELFSNGTSQGTKSCDPSGTLFPFPNGLPAGTYTFTATATGPAGTSDPSDPVQQVIAAKKPGKRGVKVTGGGLELLQPAA